jgi:ParB family transcriptional regulator, chromosome partitioning protein
VSRPGGLGRGLQALIPSGITPIEGGEESRLEHIAVDLISPSAHQPRVHFDEETLAELAASIAEIGVLQPLLVRPVSDGSYELVAGERRWRAARRAGLAVVPALVRQTDDLGSIEQALVENLHRQDLTPLEEAAAFQQLIEDFELTHEQVAGRVGKSRSAVTNTLRLLSLPATVQSLMADGRLSAGHAKALLGTPDRAFQDQLARRAANESWSVRMVEDAVRRRSGERTAPSPAPESESEVDGVRRVAPLRAPGLMELEHLLSEHLDTQVGVSMGIKRGKVTIAFADLEDLERIFHLMTGPASAAPLLADASD